jgi:prepilin-type processing-associated H-X9-DG protein
MGRVNRRGAFTLVEALLVLGVSGLLLGLGAAAVQKARATAARAACQNNLHQLRLAVELYREANARRFPDAARIPGLGLTGAKPSLLAALGPYLEDSAKVFRCPADPSSPRAFGLYGTSYEYNAEDTGVGRGVANRTLEQVVNRSPAVEPSSVLLVFDLDDFHGPAGSPPSRNYLYADGHID